MATKKKTQRDYMIDGILMSGFVEVTETARTKKYRVFRNAIGKVFLVGRSGALRLMDAGQPISKSVSLDGMALRATIIKRGKGEADPRIELFTASKSQSPEAAPAPSPKLKSTPATKPTAPTPASGASPTATRIVTIALKSNRSVFTVAKEAGFDLHKDNAFRNEVIDELYRIRDLPPAPPSEARARAMARFKELRAAEAAQVGEA